MRDGLAVAGGVMIRRGAMEELLLLALLGLGGAPIIRWFRRAFGSPEAVSGDSARALLRRRYAAGEIYARAVRGDAADPAAARSGG